MLLCDHNTYEISKGAFRCHADGIRDENAWVATFKMSWKLRYFKAEGYGPATLRILAGDITNQR